MFRLAYLPEPGAYVRLWRRAYAEADAGRLVRLAWNGPDLDAAGVRRAFRVALDRRINLRGSVVQVGRNWDPDQQLRFRRDQRAIGDQVLRRVRVHQLETRTARERFGHLLATRED